MRPPTPPPVLSADLLEQIRQTVDRFEAECQAGSPPVLEQLVEQAPPEARPELFRQLVRLELDQRQGQGKPLTAREAGQRFGSLGPWVGDVLAVLGLEENAVLTLTVIAGPRKGNSYQLNGHSGFYVGRGPAGVHLALEGDQGMSKVHFLIEYNPPRARLADLRSKNGTFLNGLRTEQNDLRDGDEIRAGFSTFKVQLPQEQRTLTLAGQSDSPAPSLPATAPLFPVLPGFRLEQELGRGGMGIVYRACRLADSQVVALKTTLPAIAPRPETLDRFQREVSILRRLKHPNIVAFLDSGEAGGILYFVMEYVEGTSASQAIKVQGPFLPERVVRLGCQLLDALAHAHLQGIVHRDVKPGNVLLTQQDGRELLKVADFGLGRAYQESAMSGLTLIGTSGGTPGYVAPEQIIDFHAARPAADQYATAATLYYLLTGKTIYEPEDNHLNYLLRLQNHEPLPLRQPAVGPSLPSLLGAVLRRALARDPRQRFPDVLAMREALSRSV